MNKESIRKIIQAHHHILIKYNVTSISLFGSYLREEQNPKSDIDLLVDLNEKADLFDLIELQYELEDLLGKKVSLVSRRGLNKYIAPYILKEAELIG